ncbi:hypothetical protein JCGZ_10331 [Jatropha curcas]|uniref:PGG domain-containing protein n=1 Tax=Jatropha curcas TaxID=180498 RepID=A0A067KUA1_JATCU|nr:hypothetical protein JCGZ_10331 [Jatropha curcas]
MATKIVLQDLDGNNYADWRIWMKNYLLANDLWDVIEADEKLGQDEAELKAWTRKNAAALHAIHVSCSLEAFSHIRETDSAKSCWETLAIMNEVKPAVRPPATLVDAYAQFHPLREAIEKGNLNSVKTFLHLHPDTVHRKVSGFGETALHLATKAGNIKIVEFLVELMSVEELQAVNEYSATALIFAAVIGATRIAECMVRKTMKLVTTAADGDLPVIVACNNGHKETTRFLYSLTPFEILLEDNGVFGSLLLHASIYSEMFGLKQIYDRKLRHTYALKILELMAKHVSSIDDTKLNEKYIYNAFFKAIRHGVVEVVVEMIRANYILLSVVNRNSRDMLMHAIKYRQEKVFSLIYVLGSRKQLLISGSDDFENTILHMAARLAPPDRLAGISGAALQMQRELQWYKEVESISIPSYKEYTNKNNEQASEIFSKSHKELIKDGEKWMKETATSCTVVGALIITIMFTTAFTVPGGNVQETGFPMFAHEKSFMIFIISDAVSLFASSTSVLMFLGVLTSRYSEDDFLKSLPTKLIIGLSTLFISIAAMMVAFCATLMIMLEGELRLVFPIIFLASIPVTLFILLQFPLLVEIFISTYGPGIFDRKMKPWY